MDLPSDAFSTTLKGNMNLEDLGDALTKINAEFQLPAELLE
jgi:hypothetical protein